MNYLEQNLAIMRPRDPELALLMENDIDCSHIEVIPTHEPNVLTARVTLPSGEKVLLHNMVDPIGSATRSAQKQDMKGENASILLGFGLGYLAIELAKKLEKKHPIIICEADPAILKIALTHVDLSEVLSSDYIRILVGDEIPLHDWIHKLSAKFMTARVDVIAYGPSNRLDPDAYQQLTEIAQKESRAIILNRNTVLKAGQQMLENILQNFPDVLQSAGVRNLEGLFKGRPAIVVSAGPSLEKNVHLLRELDGRAVIISVDTALRLLLPLGIKPDVVTTIDFNQKNFEKFANVPIDSDISLVYHPGGYYESIRAFQGPQFTSSQVPNRIPHWLMQFVEDKGGLPSGTTVAHLSFFLARHMGCDPIVFIGQDLAFPQNKVHAGDLSLWDINKDEMDMIEDIFGEPVGSMSSFKHAIYHFEKAFKETQATIIDATEAGAKKQGALVMRLRDVIDEYGQVPAINIKEILRTASRNVEAVRMEELLCELKRVNVELNVVQKGCREIMRVAKQLQKRIVARQTKDDEFVKLSEKAEMLTQAMDERGRVLYLMGEHNYGLELYMLRHEVVAIDEIEEVDDKIAQQVMRAMLFYPSVEQAAETFKKPLNRLIQRLQRARELDSQELVSTASAEAWYQRAQAYDRIESRREALQSVHEALVRDPEHVPALKLLTRLCLDGNRLDEALAAVKVLGDLAKPDRNLANLTQEAQAKHNAWSERCARLNAEFSGKTRKESEEEAGCFYYRTKDYPRAIAHLERVISGIPTAEAYARLGQARSKLGDTNGAFEAWEKGIEFDPGRADLYKELGTLALAQSMNEQAEQFLGEAFRLEPDDAETCERLARLYLDRSAYVEAAQCYESLLRLSPGRSDLIPEIAALYQRQIAVAANTH